MRVIVRFIEARTWGSLSQYYEHKSHYSVLGLMYLEHDSNHKVFITRNSIFGIYWLEYESHYLVFSTKKRTVVN